MQGILGRVNEMLGKGYAPYLKSTPPGLEADVKGYLDDLVTVRVLIVPGRRGMYSRPWTTDVFRR